MSTNWTPKSKVFRLTPLVNLRGLADTLELHGYMVDVVNTMLAINGRFGEHYVKPEDVDHIKSIANHLITDNPNSSHRIDIVHKHYESN